MDVQGWRGIPDKGVSSPMIPKPHVCLFSTWGFLLGGSLLWVETRGIPTSLPVPLTVASKVNMLEGDGDTEGEPGQGSCWEGIASRKKR